MLEAIGKELLDEICQVMIQLNLHQQLLENVERNGKEMVIVMMTIIMLVANLMEEIAVETMSRKISALNANACKLLENVEIPNGKEMVIVMTTITMLVANLMEEIAVEIMSRKISVLYANVCNDCLQILVEGIGNQF